MPKVLTRVAVTVSIIIIAAWVAAFMFFSFFPEESIPDYSKGDGKITIVATIYPLAYFALDLDPVAEVTTIVGPGVEPHDYEPTIDDVKKMQDAEILLLNGGVDEWAAGAIEDGRNGVTIDVLHMLAGSSTNPHVWLDPVYGEEIVRRIGEQLKYVDPDRADVIEKNVESKIAEIRGIDIAYRAALSNCEIPEIVTTHDAFEYVARAYGFLAYSATGINPDEEPSAATVAELVDFVRTHRIPTVFAETLIDDRIATTIANETGATVETLNPIESLTPGYDAASAYPTLMRENLEKISKAMVCQQ